MTGMNYAEIKRTAERLDVPVTALIALTPRNDPFYMGTPADKAMGEWFQRLFVQLGFQSNFRRSGTKAHIRRVHYAIVSQDPPVLMHTGEPYLNTMKCWDYLLQASKVARYLGLVSPDAFDDKKNPEAHVYADNLREELALHLFGSLWEGAMQFPDFPEFPYLSVSGFSGAQRFHIEILCFPPETLVQTITGPKTISSIQVGELVLTHKGRYRPVTHTFQRPYSGKLVRVRTHYSARAVRMTPNHQVLTLQGKQSHGGITAKELAWIAAGDLVGREANGGAHYRGDYLAFPRLDELPAVRPTIEPDREGGGRANGSGAAPASLNALPVDLDTAWMLGFFLGDGHVGSKGVLFALNASEQVMAERLMQIGSRFGIQPTLARYGNTLRVAYNSVRLRAWFRQQFGGKSLGRAHTGAQNKRIPPWMLAAPEEIARAFLDGYWQADGTVDSSRHQSVVTSSLEIAEGLRLLLVRLGCFPTVTITRAGHYQLRWGGRFQWGKMREDYLLMPIRERETEPYEGTVYNLEVAEDNSYVTEFAVHNCEKTTINDIVLPLCSRYGVNYQTGAGELSITAALNLAKRIQAGGRPARIAYISDYDPGGQSMVVALSRKLEYFVRTLGIQVDIRLYPLVLTAEQIALYHLPRTPIKETEKRRDRFEALHGSGGAELDALEATQPGVLAAIIEAFILRYYDTTLATRVREEERALGAAFDAIQARVLAELSVEIDEVRAAHERLRAEFDSRMQAHRAELDRVWRRMSSRMQELRPRLEDYPIPQAAEAADDPAGVYDSNRDYARQILAYKQFQGK